jgi:sodium-dependent dicarboxylate transporter 2/3/5
MERWNLHRKLALKFLLLIGERPRMMMAGFMAITAFLSMWISNTATTSMMTPLVLAVLGQLKKKKEAPTIEEGVTEGSPVDEPVPLDQDTADLEHITTNSADDNTVELDLVPENHSSSTPEQASHAEDLLRFSKASLLGIAYAASIGGTATLVGTGTNVILVQTFSKLFPTAPPISFGGWFLFATPLALLLLAVTFGLLTVIFTRNTTVSISRFHLQVEHDKVGPFRWAQWILMADLVFMVTAWFIRPILTQSGVLKSGYITDGTISMVAGLVLFILPSFQDHPPGSSLESPVSVADGGERVPHVNEDEDPAAKRKAKKTLRIADNETLLDVPWDIVMLLGGGLALAEGFSASGLSVVLAQKLNVLSHMPLYFMISLISLVVLFTTELTSNIATVTLVLPILAAMAQSTTQHPLLLMIPATICCSLAFMLPVATPPNAIVFSSNILRVADMAKAGFLLNLLSLILVPAYMLTLGSIVFGINFKQFPDWAIPPAPSASVPA